MIRNRVHLSIARIISITNFIYYVVSKFTPDNEKFNIISLFFSLSLAIMVNLIITLKDSKNIIILLEFLGWFGVICVIFEFYILSKIINVFTVKYTSFLIVVYYISVSIISYAITKYFSNRAS